jgi:hypothetical protein
VLCAISYRELLCAELCPVSFHLLMFCMVCEPAVIVPPVQFLFCALCCAGDTNSGDEEMGHVQIDVFLLEEGVSNKEQPRISV